MRLLDTFNRLKGNGMKKSSMRILLGRMPVVFALAGGAMAAQASPVKAPPLPPGSDMVRVAPGLTPEEVTRQKRAHKHSGLEKKDFTRDDTLDAVDSKDPKPSKDPKVK
jgi:hypothetical protein